MSLTISLTVDQVEQRFRGLGIPSRYTPDEHLKFSTTPVVASGRALFGFPTPSDNSALTLSNLKAILGTDPSHQPAFFEHPWYADEPFMASLCTPGWHFLLMEVHPESVSQPFDYVRRLKSEGMELPSAIEVVLMLFLHYEGTKEQLLLRKHTWCSDSASLERQVTVGAFGRNGLFVSGHPRGFASRGLGICGKIPVP
jgi:hypothetical protein